MRWPFCCWVQASSQPQFPVPADYQQGDSFRILYIHVPSAWMSLFVFGLMAVYAAIALIWRIKVCEILAMACAPIGAQAIARISHTLMRQISAIAAYTAINPKTNKLIHALGTWM